MVNKKLFKLLSTFIVTFSVLLTSCNSSQESNSGNSSNNGGEGSSNTSHEHTFDSKWEYNDTYHWHPSTCGHDVKGDKERHNFTSIVKDPTYEQGGYTTYTCFTCGYSYVDNETNKLEHNYSSTWSYDEYSHWHSCTDKGYEHLKKDESNHTFTTSITDPTYEQGGYTTYTCSTCGYSYTDDEVDKLEHNYSSTWSYDEYSHWHACTDDGYEHLKKDEGSHTFTTSVTNPTYESGGYTTYTCSTCGYSYTDDEVDALPIAITWKNYDGTVLEVDNNVPYGTMPSYDGETPTKESDSNYDYIFAGWTPSVVIATQPTTYVATFSNQEITYTIDFDLNGGTSSSYKGPIEVKTFSKDIFFFDYVREDWQFRGWEYNNEKIFDEKGNQLKNVTLVDNMVFKAIYSQTVKLTITTNMPEAGIITGEGEYPYNTYVDVSVTPNQGYKFVGWYYQNTLLSNEENYKYMMWDKDVTLEARFEKDDFNLRIYTNNENYGLVLLKSNSVIDDYLPEYAGLKEYGSEVTIAAYSKSDVRFLGWYDENNELVTTNAVYTFVMPNYDYTLEAKWNYFTINYNLNGGVNNKNNVDHFDLEDTTIYLFAPTKEGYSFEGWKYNGEFVDKIDASIACNITLEAVWSPYEYEIKEDDNGKYASIISFDESISDIVIPKYIEVNGEQIVVKVIKDNTFYDNGKITSITIPDSVTTIGDSAFSGCSSLTSIYIPNSVTTIGDYTFSGCSNLTTVTISDNSQLTTIGVEAFSGCSSLTSIYYIPDSVTTIGAYAFYECSKLTIYCEASSQPSGWSSSWNSSNRPVVWNCISSFEISDEGLHFVVALDENGDKYITIVGYTGSSTNVVIPSSINVNGEDIPIKEISEEAFYNNDNLTSIYIPDSVTTIGSSAFYNCDSLTSIYIPDSVTTIRGWAFENCSSLTSIYIPDNVTTIGESAFDGCSNLTTVIISDNSQLTTIGDYAFSGCSSLTSIYIPDSVSTIGGYVFSGCSNLTTVTISENSQLTTIGYSAFYNCSSLTSIYIPSSVTSIGDYAFRYCSNLTTVTISENSQLTSIGDYTFYNCSSLTSIYIPSSVTTIGYAAFRDCTNLTIYCEASSQPSGWDSTWNDSDRPVVWSCTYDEYLAAIA